MLKKETKKALEAWATAEHITSPDGKQITAAEAAANFYKCLGKLQNVRRAQKDAARINDEFEAEANKASGWDAFHWEHIDALNPNRTPTNRDDVRAIMEARDAWRKEHEAEKQNKILTLCGDTDEHSAQIAEANARGWLEALGYSLAVFCSDHFDELTKARGFESAAEAYKVILFEANPNRAEIGKMYNGEQYTYKADAVRVCISRNYSIYGELSYIYVEIDAPNNMKISSCGTERADKFNSYYKKTEAEILRDKLNTAAKLYTVDGLKKAEAIRDEYAEKIKALENERAAKLEAIPEAKIKTYNN